MVRAGVISDEFWAVAEPLVPANGGRRGRPWNDHRDMLEAICWRYRTGSPWRDLPQELGRWQTVWARHFRWSTDGTYDRILTAAKSSGFLGAAETDAVVQLLSVDSTVVRAHQHAAGARKTFPSEVVSTTGESTGALSNYTDLPVEPADHALGRSRGGLSTKIHTLTDQRCCPVTVILTPGQSGDNPQLVPLLVLHKRQQPRGRGRRFRVLADRAYSHPSTRKELRRRRIGNTIPQRTDQQSQRKAKGSRRGRPPGFDAEDYSCATPWNVDTPGSSSGGASPPGMTNTH